jgi:hypothetical protein
MAKKGSQDNSTSNVTTRSFIRGMNKDFDSTYVPEGFWTHARNAQNNTIDGNLGEISNEPSNFHCASAPYTIIGAVHLFGDKWVVYSTDDTNSEIGLYDQSECCYLKIVNDSCLGFDKKNLIYGVSKETAACTWQLYWADGLNPDRSLNIGNPKSWPQGCILPLNYLWDGPPWKQECTIVDGCKTCVDLPILDCDRTRLARLVKTPCLRVQNGPGNGTLQKGSYFAVIAYTIEGQKVTDYFSPSNVQPLFDRENELGSSLEIIIEEMDTEHFDEFELVVVSFVDEQTVATKIGNYSTRVNVIELDAIDPTLAAVPIEQIPIRNNVYEKSDIITTLNNYLLRLRPSTYFDFNYQPLANQIVATWACVEYSEDYYRKGGSKTSYMRDEVYAFYIRWIYDTGYKSPSYHIPGRAKIPGVDDIPIVNLDSVQYINDGVSNEVWNVYNTATGANTPPVPVIDQQGIVGNIIARGNMGYWESTEIYPDDKPEIWNSSSQPWSGITLPKYDLCGKNIRHHKMPDMFILDISKLNSNPWPYYNFDVAHFRTDTVTEQKYIRILGVEFGNIILPKDNDGNDIPNIVGYEILRATRKGNKTIIAKGLINNMGEYKSEMETNASSTSKRILYQNYPYNDVRPDPFLIKNSLINQFENGDPFDVFKRDYLSFHSPDTQFDSHFLSTTQIKNHAVYSGLSTGQFIEPSQHPKFKQLGDFIFLAALTTGIAIGVTSTTGSINAQYDSPFVYNPLSTIGPVLVNATFGTTLTAFNLAQTPAQSLYTASTNPIFNVTPNAGSLDAYFATIQAVSTTAANTSAGFSVPYPTYTKTGGLQNNLFGLSNLLSSIAQVLGIIGESTDTLLRTFYTLIPAQQYALQYISQGYYSRPLKVNVGNINREILDASYIRPGMVDFRGERLVNNINRNRFALIKTAGAGILSFEFPNNTIQSPLLQDKSRVTIGTVGSQAAFDPFTTSFIIQNNLPTYAHPGNEFRANLLSYYSSIKLRKRNQYGQLDAPRQIPIGHCESKINFDKIDERTFTAGGKVYIHKVIPTAGEFFNGDIYICRYTEKTTMFYFYEWLYGQPENFEYNYGLRRMVPYPKYWVNNKILSTSSAIAGTFSSLANIITPGSLNTSGTLPSQFRKFDNDLGVSLASAFFFPFESYFYLFNSGVRDFFVESEILVDFREQGQDVRQRFYDPNGYSDLTEIFKADPNIITTDNYYSYDKSLSVSRLFNNYISWGNLQSIYYSPYDSEFCYSYYPQRVIYSLPDTPEAARDNWYIFLSNNYKEYRNKLTYAKDINKNGGLFFFEDASPIQVVGVDQLQTDLNTKITIGDGGLFSQPFQRIVNADSPFEYASCQDPMSVISTPAGLFWMSANQGKVYQYSGGLEEISNQGLKWWFYRYAKYALLEDFPDFPLTNNPVSGIGVMMIYDNVDAILYITHKDYKLKDRYKGNTQYNPDTNSFTIRQYGTSVVVKLNEGEDYKTFFEDASWTVSYDAKSKMWISFHDWHPDYVIPNKERFVTTKQNKMWYHNFNCQSYCNFYGIDYPFEIETPVPTGNQIFSLRSIEYTMEAYKHNIQCSDSFHDLDFNFDEAVIWNTEQVSGLLKLNLQAKNNPIANLAYPIVNPGSIDILYSKEEQKYRFNQFWDITDDRGEFFNPGIPGFAERTIWNTEANGYIKNLNPNNLNYNKLQTQRKKFRHYINFILLRRKVSGNRNIQLRIVNEKQQYSSR